MKSRLNILLVLASMMVASVSLTSCSDDDFTSSIFDTTEYPLDRTQFTFPLDTFVKKNFLETYNLQFIYKMQDIGSDLQKNLVPAAYDKSVDLAVLSKYLWYDVYKKHAGELFLKKYSPRIIHVIGSPAYNPTQGTETLGTAEGGLKITLYKTNALDVYNIDLMNEYFFKTMHHEFAHILDQTYQRPNAFNLISVGRYNVDWGNTHDSIAAGQGFVSPYASYMAREDWVEVLANYVVKDENTWNTLLSTAHFDWEEIDISSAADYTNLEHAGCNYDTIGIMRTMPNGDLKVVRKVVARNTDGTVALDENGKIQFLDVDGVDGRAVILQKLELVRAWLADNWGINIDALRAEVQKRQYMTKEDGSFETYTTYDKYGNPWVKYINRLVKPLEGDPSTTLIDSLRNEVNVFKQLQY